MKIIEKFFVIYYKIKLYLGLPASPTISVLPKNEVIDLYLKFRS